MDQLLEPSEATKRNFWVRKRHRRESKRLQRGLRNALERNRPESTAIAEPHDAEARPANTSRVREHGLKHRLQLSG